MFKSVYGDICESQCFAGYVGPFCIQEELVYAWPEQIKLSVAYTPEGHYVGDLDTARWLVQKGITAKVQPKCGGATCTIGFSPHERKWYGWSSRAVAGFAVGDCVREGDCAFSPSNKQELEARMLSFWDCDDPYAWRECEDETVVCKNVLYRSCQSRQDGVLGWLIVYKTIFIGAPEREGIHSHFTPYPKKWGRGAWTIKTLADAKQAAINYSQGVS